MTRAQNSLSAPSAVTAPIRDRGIAVPTSGEQFYVWAERVYRCRGKLAVNAFFESYNNVDQRLSRGDGFVQGAYNPTNSGDPHLAG